MAKKLAAPVALFEPPVKVSNSSKMVGGKHSMDKNVSVHPAPARPKWSLEELNLYSSYARHDINHYHRM
jgi:hypothetical protein